MKKLFICLFLLQCSAITRAQDYHYIDSLKKVLSTTRQDTIKVQAYISLSDEYAWYYPDTSLSYAMPGLALAKKIRYERGELRMLFAMSEALATQYNYSRALQLRFQSLELAKKLNMPEGIALAYFLIGTVYADSRIDDEKALFYYRKSMASHKTLFPRAEVMYGSIGGAYFRLNQLDSAFFYISKAYDLNVKSSHRSSRSCRLLAAILEKKDNPAKAIELYRISVNLATSEYDFASGYKGMASAFSKTGQTDSAIFYAKAALSEDLHSPIPQPLVIVEASALLASIYKADKNIDSAFKYQNLLLAAKDSISNREKVNQLHNIAFDEQMRQQEIEVAKVQYENKIKLYALLVALTVFSIIGILLWRNNKQKQKANELLHQQKQKIESTLSELKSTQTHLIQHEKMASLGELTAGIAHEIQNPLNFVNNFSEANKELLEELELANEKGDRAEVNIIAADLKANQEKIHHHGRRADSIVKGMLQHAKSTTGRREPTDLNALVEQYLRLAYHGYRTKDQSFQADISTHYDPLLTTVELVPQEVGRVLLNLFNNAFYAASKKKEQLNGTFEPTVTVSTKKAGSNILITVKDNGTGMPPKIAEKVFQPFFTTKPTGEGTGLGLSLSYDIVTKGHGGKLSVRSTEGVGSEFVVTLPVT
jgi:signal transduction histidine kinase